MNCWVMLLHVCLFDPSQAYVRGDLSTQIDGSWGQWVDTPSGGVRKTDSAFGRLELGVEVPLSRSFMFRYGAEHTSKITNGDRGEERAFIGFEWRPFR